MKKSNLQKIIHEAILEILDETIQKTTIDYRNPSQPDKVLDIDSSDTNTINKLRSDPNVVSATMGNKKLKEMARKPIKYILATDYQNKLAELPYVDSEKRMRWVNGIIDYIEQEGPSDPTTIAQEKFDVPQPRIADYVRDMIRLGILKPEAEGVVPQFLKPEEEKEPPIRGGEEMLIGPYIDLGSDIPSPTDEPEEDKPEEDEPELEPDEDELEKAAPIDLKPREVMDKKYEYNDLIYKIGMDQQRLRDAKKSTAPNDIASTSEEAKLIKNLEDHKKDLKTLINTAPEGTIELILKSPEGVPLFVKNYIKERPNLSQDLQNKLTSTPTRSTQASKSAKNEAMIAENYAYEIRQLQYRAGIIK